MSTFDAVDVRRLIAVQAFVWTAYGVVHFAAGLPALLDDERGVMAFAATVRAATGLFVSTAVAGFLPRVTRASRKTIGSVALLAAIAAGFSWTFLDRAVLVAFAAAARVEIPWDRFIRGMDLQYFFVMAVWITGYLTLLLVARNRVQRETLLRQEVEMREIRLNLLAAQLNPHFLFNSLNTIRTLASEDPERTREVVSRLSSFLRQVIDVNPGDLVPMSREIELARDYLEVEKARFEDGLEIEVNADNRASMALVPPLILQPLLENAVKHGEPVAGVRTVSLVATVDGDQLLLTVTNSGKLAKHRRGTGLRLTHERLEQSFPDRHEFQIMSRGNSVVASIKLPLPGT